MAKARNLGLAIGPTGVPDRHFDDFQGQLRGAEDQIEIAERIEIAEIAASGLEPLVVGAPQHFGAAQRVGETLSEQPAEGVREQLVGDEIEKRMASFSSG